MQVTSLTGQEMGSCEILERGRWGVRGRCWGSPKNAVLERRSMLSESNGSELKGGVADPVLKMAS